MYCKASESLQRGKTIGKPDCAGLSPWQRPQDMIEPNFMVGSVHDHLKGRPHQTGKVAGREQGQPCNLHATRLCKVQGPIFRYAYKSQWSRCRASWSRLHAASSWRRGHQVLHYAGWLRDVGEETGEPLHCSAQEAVSKSAWDTLWSVQARPMTIEIVHRHGNRYNSQNKRQHAGPGDGRLHLVRHETAHCAAGAVGGCTCSESGAFSVETPGASRVNEGGFF